MSLLTTPSGAEADGRALANVLGKDFGWEIRTHFGQGSTAILDDLDIYYYSESPEHEGWYRGERVIGWLVPDSMEVVEEDGQVYFEFEVNHSGVMQLGRDVSAKLGAVGALGFHVTGHPAQWIALLALLALTAWAAVPRRRLSKR